MKDEDALRVAFGRCVTVRAVYVQMISSPNISTLASELKSMHRSPSDIKFIGRRMPLPKLEKVLKLFHEDHQLALAQRAGNDEQSANLRRAMRGNADAEPGEVHVIADLRGVGGGLELQCACFAARLWARGGNRDAEKRSRPVVTHLPSNTRPLLANYS